MVSAEKIEAAVESRSYAAFFRIVVPFLLTVLTGMVAWQFNSTMENQRILDRITERVATLERSDHEFRQYRDAIGARRNEQYALIIERIAGLEEQNRGIAESVGELRGDLKELTRRMNDRQGLLLPK